MHGVKDFVLDSAEELAKILAETGGAGAADGLGLVVRLALPKGEAVYDLSGKFGAEPAEAAALLRAARPRAARLGVSFHVGSQCLDPLAWRRALALVGEVIREAGVPVEVVDVGGGFPVSYPGTRPPPLGAFFAEIEAGSRRSACRGRRALGRARPRPGGGGRLRGGAGARPPRRRAVRERRGVRRALGRRPAGFVFPVRLVRPDAPAPSPCCATSRCSARPATARPDARPFPLPEDVREGDWIEIGQLGAYGACLRTGFNGFDRARIVEVRDRPMLEVDPLSLAA
jgi:ornithine decarboxylase